ncbi:alginate export family protein [Sphingosinicella rhizophila]|uniref:Alginate export family protein n=1 Tax=Sphingosinicella rhizophila TaxID=3050082 RepID=A0ABU3QBW3_9SPHN|nr:alginate export family protein [Sphingosinicella sp. GR2756]MDT9600888.1 alginate export family protein [Sphingosinicella sp. GR2756]
MIFKSAASCSAMLTLALLAGAAHADPAAPPPFRPDRTTEDYSYLADPARRGHWQDSYKYIPLDSSGALYLSLGGELRERVELFDAPRFGLAGGQADQYGLQRILVHADLHLGTTVRVFAQLGTHEALGKKQILLPDRDRLDVHQFFVDLTPTAGLRLRLGRQEMMFSPLQRFVSFRDGTNVRQNFEGGRATYQHGPLRLEAFFTRPVTLKPGVLDNEGNDEQTFGGLYFSHRLGTKGASSIDAYWFLLDREKLGSGPVLGDERRHSLGLRHAGTSGHWDWDNEGVYQLGRSMGRDIGAWAASADIGYTWASSPVKPRFGLRFDAGSGDGDPADDRISGFHPLFPSGPYFNEANVTSWTNLLAIRPSLRVQPAERLTVQAAVQLKWREDRDDAVYLGPSAPLAATRGNRAREIGRVYTLDANFQVNRNLALRGYYLHHSAGGAIRAVGGDSIDFMMASATLRF